MSKRLKSKKNLDEALYGILAPLQQKGDSLTIGIEGGESVTINFEDKKHFKTKNAKRTKA